MLLREKINFYVVNSEIEQNYFQERFLTSSHNVKILGSPRIDVLFDKIKNADLLMESDYKNIKNFKINGKKLLIYMPTWRSSGRNISEWLNSNELKELLKKNNAILLCKLHHADKNAFVNQLNHYIYNIDKTTDLD